MELELNAVGVGASQNLLDITSASTASNDFHGMSSQNESSLIGQQQQQSSAGNAASSKKEGNLLSWFTSSSSASAPSSSTINNSSTMTANSTAATTTPPSIAPRTFDSNESEQQQQLQDGSSSPNMKISNKLSYGEKFISKFNKNGNKATSSEQHAPQHEQAPSSGVPKEPQQKSSRRTTSLLNLFMSNSQGKQYTLITYSAH